MSSIASLIDPHHHQDTEATSVTVPDDGVHSPAAGDQSAAAGGVNGIEFEHDGAYGDQYTGTASLPELCILAVILGVICLVGSVGNALVLYVFSAKRDGLVSTMFITVLAVADFTTCLVIVPLTVVFEFIKYQVHVDVVCKLYTFAITFNIPFSALVMTAIAVDRYLSICRPFCRILTLDRARTVVGILAMSAGGLGVFGSLTHGVHRYVLRIVTAAAVARRSTNETTTTTFNGADYSDGEAEDETAIMTATEASEFCEFSPPSFLMP